MRCGLQVSYFSWPGAPASIGPTFRRIAQNAEGSEPESLGVGREVPLTWMPQHTFVVAKETSNAE